MEPSDKVRENRLRRMAARQGMELRKSRRRDPRAIDYGQYWLVDQNHRVLGGPYDGMDAVERALTGSHSSAG
jgi:hypothetical protein